VKEETAAFLKPFKVFAGNKPTNFNSKINSQENLGSLVAMYSIKYLRTRRNLEYF
jgi:hypothetical protein